ncbi:MAG: DUF2612 domain-containing protein [Rhodopila sp.]|nr:DUF2612 domain-containing protein [Rhodopila sp.]
MLNFQETIYSQFGNSPTIVQLITNMNTYLDPSANIDAFYDLVWNVDTAVGYGLDVWGRIVGVGRVLNLSTGVFFGFEGPVSASGDPWNQAVFYNGQSLTANYALTDAAYRPLILAKALFNICDCSIPSINQIMVNMFGPNGPLPVAGNCYCTDTGSMTMTYTFGSALDPVQSAIVFQSGVLPRPCGVFATVVQL